MKALSMPLPGHDHIRKVGDECPYCEGFLIAHRGATTWYLLCKQYPCPSPHMFYLSEEEERIIQNEQKIGG